MATNMRRAVPSVHRGPEGPGKGVAKLFLGTLERVSLRTAFKQSLKKPLWLRSEERSFQVKEKGKPVESLLVRITRGPLRGRPERSAGHTL